MFTYDYCINNTSNTHAYMLYTMFTCMIRYRAACLYDVYMAYTHAAMFTLHTIETTSSVDSIVGANVPFQKGKPHYPLSLIHI